MGPSRADSDVAGLLPGRACRVCVHIKVKCVPLEGSNVCQRCHRLNKACTTPAPVERKATNRPKTVRSRRMSQGADHSSSDIPPNASQSQVAGLDDSAGDTFATRASLPTPPDSLLTAQGQEPTTILEQYHPLLEKRANPIIPKAEFTVELSSSQQEKLFYEYRVDMGRFLPFVIVPPNDTTDSFRKSHPVLFRACLASASHRDPPLQKALSEDTYRVIAERMLFEGQKSLDLLQALLILISWYHIYTVFNPQLMNLVHLATALAVDLGLNRPPAGFQTRLSTDTEQIIYGKSVNVGLQTNEDRRTVLGCYWLSSKLSSCMRRFDGMKFNAHLADCCKVLEDAAEYRSDLYLVNSINLRLLEERYTRTEQMAAATKLPYRMIISCFQEDLRKYRETLPPELASERMTEVGWRGVEVVVHETILNGENDSTVQRLEILWNTLLTVSSFFDAMINIAARYMPNISFIAWMHVIHALTLLAKLSFLVTEGWDLDTVRSTVSFTATVDRIIAKLEEARADETARSGQHAKYVRFAMYEEKMRQCKKWYESKIEMETRSKNLSEQQTQFAGSNMASNDWLSDPMFFGLDDNLWSDFLGNWNPVSYYGMPTE